MAPIDAFRFLEKVVENHPNIVYVMTRSDFLQRIHQT